MCSSSSSSSRSSDSGGRSSSSGSGSSGGGSSSSGSSSSGSSFLSLPKNMKKTMQLITKHINKHQQCIPLNTLMI